MTKEKSITGGEVEARCLVCGASLGDFLHFMGDKNKSECCSDECGEIYYTNPDAPANGGDE